MQSMDVHESNPKPPRLILDSVFDDMAAYGAATGGWDLDFRPLEAGPLAARAVLIEAARSTALQVSFNRRLHQQGSPPRGFVVLGLPDTPIIWCGVKVGAGEVLNFNMTGGFDGVSEAGFSGTVILLNQQAMALRAAEMGLDDRIETQVSTTVSWNGARTRLEYLRRRLDGLFRRTRTSGSQVEIAHLLNRDLPAELVKAIATERRFVEAGGATNRNRAFRVALELLEEPHSLPLSVLDLCRAADVSPSTLYRAFQEHLGVSPKRYLQLRSLNGVRSDLLAARRGSLVTEIATRWGFWHLGQFAADYRRQFGELPSETLARP